MDQIQTLRLSIGDNIPDWRLSDSSFSGRVIIQHKPVQFDITPSAVNAVSDSIFPLLVEMELYFSCLVRKQVRFSEMSRHDPDSPTLSRVIPGLYSSFRAVTTKTCNIADAGGKPQVESLPVKKTGWFVPDWVKIDHRTGQWIGEYGFKRNT